MPSFDETGLDLSLKHVCREASACASFLESSAHKSTFDIRKLHCPPAGSGLLLQDDVLGLGWPRACIS